MSIDTSENNICYAPFSQLLLSPTGHVYPCCWNQEFLLGNVNDNSFEELWNGAAIQKLRKEFLTGDINICKQQVKHLNCHKIFHYLKPHITTSLIQEKKPKRLDLRLNGTCNLKCVMCNIWSQPEGIYDSSFFWKIGPSEIFPNLLEIDMLGGEPFIQSDTFKLIQQIKTVNPACSWAFSTNANYTFDKKISDALDGLPIRWISVSIDSVVEETYVKLRKGGNFTKMLKTFTDIIAYRNSRIKNNGWFSISATMCVQKLNWKELRIFLNFCKMYGIDPHYQFAYQPSSCSILDMSDNERREILNFITTNFTGNHKEHIQGVVAAISDSLVNSSSVGHDS